LFGFLLLFFLCSSELNILAPTPTFQPTNNVPHFQIPLRKLALLSNTTLHLWL
jgi:hypothetical protein